VSAYRRRKPFNGILCAIGFKQEQVNTRGNDHINVLALPSDYVDFESSKGLIEVFLNTPSHQEEKYLRRIKELDQTASNA
jgi:ribose 5-phosphate isomerase RpiB